ncbi:MAG TPA: hypothetical protein VIT42_11845 [Microlunatus sp.]
MEGTGISQDLELLPALASVLSVRTGTACSVDSPGLALALAAGPSQAGAWVGIVGLPDLGWEAAFDLGLDLGRTIAVPDPGDHWLSVIAGLIDVTTVVVVRPPGRVSEAQAARVAARLRQRGSVMVAVGGWPRSALSLMTVSNRWSGLGRGFGHLSNRGVTVAIRTGAAAIREVQLGLSAEERTLVCVDPNAVSGADAADVLAG